LLQNRRIYDTGPSRQELTVGSRRFLICSP
jgi:hypothetical protein